MMQWLVKGKELTSRQCKAEFGVIHAVTAVDFGKLIEMTIPEKPSSSKQKYRLTAKGKDFLARETEGGEE